MGTISSTDRGSQRTRPNLHLTTSSLSHGTGNRRAPGQGIALEGKNDLEEQPTGLVEALEVAIKDPPTHEDIAALAYALWQDRGCPEGTSGGGLVALTIQVCVSCVRRAEWRVPAKRKVIAKLYRHIAADPMLARDYTRQFTPSDLIPPFCTHCPNKQWRYLCHVPPPTRKAAISGLRAVVCRRAACMR